MTIDEYLESIGGINQGPNSGATTSGGFDWGNLFSADNLINIGIPLLGGWIASNSDSEFFNGPAPNQGYQGGIPDYTAVRTTVPDTYDPNRRPGSGGQRYFTDMQYVPTSDAAGIEQAWANAGQQAQGLRSLNRGNPARQDKPSLDWYKNNPDITAGLDAIMGNPDWTDEEKIAQIVAAMDQYNLSPFMLSEATGVPVNRIYEVLNSHGRANYNPIFSGGDYNQTSPTPYSNTASPTSGSGGTTSPTSGSGDTTSPTSGSGDTTSPTSGSGAATSPTSGSGAATSPTSGSGDTTSPTSGSGDATSAGGGGNQPVGHTDSLWTKDTTGTSPSTSGGQPVSQADFVRDDMQHALDALEAESLVHEGYYDSLEDAYYAITGKTWREALHGPEYRWDHEVPGYVDPNPDPVPVNNVITDPNWRSPEEIEYLRKYGMDVLGGESVENTDGLSAQEANWADHLAEMERLGSDRPDDTTQQFYDDMNAQYGASSPAQGTREQTSTYSPLQAAIDATRRVVEQEPDNQFAKQKLQELLAISSGGSGSGNTSSDQEYFSRLLSSGNLSNSSIEAATQYIQDNNITPEQIAGWTGHSVADIQDAFAANGINNFAGGGYVGGGGDGMADDIATSIDGGQQAALSSGEFVIPADVVSHLGNGNSERGAGVLHDMMNNVRMARTGTAQQGRQIDPTQLVPGVR